MQWLSGAAPRAQATRGQIPSHAIFAAAGCLEQRVALGSRLLLLDPPPCAARPYQVADIAAVSGSRWRPGRQAVPGGGERMEETERHPFRSWGPEAR